MYQEEETLNGKLWAWMANIKMDGLSTMFIICMLFIIPRRQLNTSSIKIKFLMFFPGLTSQVLANLLTLGLLTIRLMFATWVFQFNNYTWWTSLIFHSLALMCVVSSLHMVQLYNQLQNYVQDGTFLEVSIHLLEIMVKPETFLTIHLLLQTLLVQEILNALT